MSLILLEKVTSNWEKIKIKNLGCFSSNCCALASDGACAVLHLVKSIRFGIEECSLRPIVNRAILGFVETTFDQKIFVHMFDKRKLFSTRIIPVWAQRRRIEVEEGLPVVMNSTRLISFKEVNREGVSSDFEVVTKIGLMKKDFWM